MTAKNLLQRTRKKLAETALTDRQAHFNEAVAAEGIKQQLASPPVNELSPSSLRGRVVAQLIAEDPPTPASSEDIARRVSALADLLELCTLDTTHPKRRVVADI